MLTLCENYQENIKRIDAALRADESFDLIKKILYLGKQQITMYYIDGFVESGSMNKLMIYLLSLKEISPADTPVGEESARYFLEHSLPYVEAEVATNPDTMIQMVLSGTTLILGETFGASALVLDSRTYPTRWVGEP